MIQTIERASSLSGTVELPGDKSISHRYAMLAAVAQGATTVKRFAASQDCRSTLRCLRDLGASIETDGDTVVIVGRGLRGLSKPNQVLDAGNSGTTIRLLSGILAGQNFESSIAGDESLSGRPMARIIAPLRLMGAQVEARHPDLPPLRISGGKLKSMEYRLPVASAQVKSCVLLAGMYADGPTTVLEKIPTRDHTEISLAHFGANLRIDGERIEIDPEPSLKGQRLVVPGDLSGAAFFLVAAALVPGSSLSLPGVGLNRRRRELLNYLLDCGLDVVIERESDQDGEPRGDLRVRFSESLLKNGMAPIKGPMVAALIDEIPALCILGTQVTGGLDLSDARELRVKESDRIAALARNLRAMGADLEEKPDGLRIPGPQILRGADIETRGDHRIAMAFAVAGLVARGETRIGDAECADVSFPGFWQALRQVIQ